MERGRVKWFNAEKVSVHRKGRRKGRFRAFFSNKHGWLQDIGRSAEVEFEVVEGAKGPQAANVTKA